MSNVCTIPPQGWACTRAADHDGPCAAVPAGEADYQRYREWLASTDDGRPDGTLESLATCASMLEEYGPDCFPANEQGHVHFARSMMDATAADIRAFLAAQGGAK